MKSLLLNLLPSSLLALVSLFPLLPTPTTASPLIIVYNGDSFGACKSSYQQDRSSNVTWVSVWDEAGLRRYRFTFDGADLIQNKGQDFLTRVRCHDGNDVANNWQCWGPGADGKWTFDISEYDGPVGADYMNRAIQDVSGKWPGIPG